MVDPVKAGVDCALQIFPAASTELISRPLFPVRRVFCATPQYLAGQPEPQDPRDRWTFHRDGGELTTYLAAALLTNSVHLPREYALEHAGIVCLPTLVAGEAIRQGQLRIVLPAYQLPSFWLSAVYAGTSRNAFKLKLFIEHITAAFARVPPWDAALIERDLLPADLIEG